MKKEYPLDIVGSAEFGRYSQISSANTYNMIIADKSLVPYAGYKSLLNLPVDGEVRAIFRSIPFNHLVVVASNRVFVLSTSLAVAQVGEIQTESGPVYIAENGVDQIAIVDGSENVYNFNHVDLTFTRLITDGNQGRPLFRAIYITFQDGYFIVADGLSNQFRLSDLNNASSFPSGPSNIGILQTDGDRPLAVVKFRRQLFIMGSTVTDIRHNVGNTLFPYQLDNSIAINYGVLSAETIAAEFDLLVWLAQNRNSGPTIVFSTGGMVKHLATDGIEFLLDRLQRPEDSSAFLFQENGHIFYQITFRFDNLTLTYDFTTEKFFTLTNEKLDAHIAKQAAFFNNKNYFISTNDTKVYEFSTRFSDYDGKSIPRIRITRPFRFPDAARFLINEVNLTMRTGLSPTPQRLLFSMSKDGGASFGNVFSKDLKTFGDRINKVRFFRLGSSNVVVFKFQFWTGDLVAINNDPNFSYAVEKDESIVVNGGVVRLIK